MRWARSTFEPSLELTLADVLRETLDDLRAEPDPRVAVIAAYARLERTLAAFGMPRRDSDAPLEYLERILVELDVGAESRLAVDAAVRAREVLDPTGRAGDEDRGDCAPRGDQSRSAGRRRRAGARADSGGTHGGATRMRRLGAVAGLLAAPTVVYVVAVVLAPGRSSVITHIYLVVVSGGALAALALALARTLRPAEPSAFERGLHRAAGRSSG